MENINNNGWFQRGTEVYFRLNDKELTMEEFDEIANVAHYHPPVAFQVGAEYVLYPDSGIPVGTVFKCDNTGVVFVVGNVEGDDENLSLFIPSLGKTELWHAAIKATILYIAEIY